MNAKAVDKFSPPADAVWFLPLGGCGEIGMNFTLYGTNGKWLIVDCGVTFGDETTPGIELIMPDISFIAARNDSIVGLVITHGHEDHIGAIPHLWPQLLCPIFATPFTAELIRTKLGPMGLGKRVSITEVPNGGRINLAPFQISMIPVTHSIPESHMLGIDTPHGTILHTGDWKFDPEPLVGHVTDIAHLQALGTKGVMALIGDSTNSIVPGHSGSEREVQDEFFTLFGTIRQRIIVTCFASNIARLKSIARAAHKHGRYVSLVGRSLWRNASVAEACGYLDEFSDFLNEDEAMMSPRDKIVMVCTGCQGEPRSALSRIAVDDHPEVSLDEGDVVIFSSRDIPGNEKAIARVQNNLVARGVTIICGDDAPVHVSGHAAEDELTQLIQWAKPKLLVPVHGELRHQKEHERLGQALQVPQTLIPTDGQLIHLFPGQATVVDEVTFGRMGLDGKNLRRLDKGAARMRKALGANGAIVGSVALDESGRIARDPQITLIGLEDSESENEARCNEISAVIRQTVADMPKSGLKDDAAVRHAVSLAIRRHITSASGKKPQVDVHVMRI